MTFLEQIRDVRWQTHGLTYKRLDDLLAAAGNEIERQAAEVARLREALETIRDLDAGCYDSDAEAIARALNVARYALG